jgi:putative endonuclease
MPATPAIGPAGEAAAEREYVGRGYRVLARNWRCRVGELDLIVARGDMLVICEVKTRRGGSLGAGYEAVDRRKQAKVRAVAEAFLLRSGNEPLAIRFDVASVALRTDGSTDVELFEDAF